MKNKRKKDFWDMSFNPVWGCLNECPYCYARKIAKRYAKQIAEKEMNYHYKEYWKHHNDLTHNHELLYQGLKQFFPTWLESNYVRSFPKKPSIIFVNSMSDPAYWRPIWYRKILKRITENIQHTFVILTKQPEVYRKYHFPHNTILGVSCTTQNMLNKFECDLSNWFEPLNPILISIEPIQEKIKFNGLMKYLMGKKTIKWIHVGQESGNRKNRIKATPEMIKPFYDLNIPVFMKENLRGICLDELRKEFPEL